MILSPAESFLKFQQKDYLAQIFNCLKTIKIVLNKARDISDKLEHTYVSVRRERKPTQLLQLIMHEPFGLAYLARVPNRYVSFRLSRHRSLTRTTRRV